MEKFYGKDVNFA